jgi:Leucine-rich repeat (LRR) protein
VPNSIGNLVQLKVVDLDENQLKTLPEEMNNLVVLKELYLGTNPWVSFPDSLKPLLEKMLYGQSDLVKKLVTTPKP